MFITYKYFHSLFMKQINGPQLVRGVFVNKTEVHPRGSGRF